MASVHTSVKLLAISACIGIGVGAGIMYVAGVHNPQNESYGAPWSELQNLVFLGLVSALGVGASSFCFMLAVRWLKARSRR